jgi:hypothetical protein
VAVCGCGESLPGRRRKCDSCKAGATETSSAVVQSSNVPAGLGDRGAALWVALAGQLGTPRGELVLEACRTADRLNDIDAVIAGRGVLNLMQFRLDLDLFEDDRRKVEVTVKISGVLGEARLQAAALAALLTRLGVGGAPVVKPGDGDGPKGESPLAQVLALVRPGS